MFDSASLSGTNAVLEFKKAALIGRRGQTIPRPILRSSTSTIRRQTGMSGFSGPSAFRNEIVPMTRFTPRGALCYEVETVSLRTCGSAFDRFQYRGGLFKSSERCANCQPYPGQD